MRAFLLSALLLASAFQAALGAVDGDWEYIVLDYLSIGGISPAAITGYTGSAKVVTTPYSVGGYPVIQLGYSSSGGFNSITTLTIVNVRYIADRAFQGCTGLTSITLPNSVTNIRGYAFSGCSGLTSITFPSNLTMIGERAFEGCTGLTNITIPNSVQSIGDYAFQGCSGVFYLPGGFGGLLGLLGLTSAQVIPYDASNLASVYLAGQQSVIANPSTHNLYTTSQIQNMAVGDLVLTKNADGSFTLNYDIEKSEDLQTWTTYRALELTLTGLPTDKAFVRIKAKQ